jgi:Leucine-rich repeat (LRR) protein
VTPTLAGYTFNPTSHSYSNVTSNQVDQYFVANAVISTYTISGTVTSGGIALPNVVMSGLPGNSLTNSSGQYSGLVNSGWTGTVTPVLAGYTFTPTNRTYSGIIANQTGQDYSAIAIIIPTTMRQVLIDLYNSTNGDSWTNKTGWKTPPLHSDGFALPGTEGTWYGVYIDTGNMIQLNLGNNNLVGTIPTSLGNLNGLISINLNSNKLSGTIPVSLGNLSNLQSLGLVINQLTGSIPAELGNLNKLEWLEIHSNYLTGSIPATLGNLSSLKTITLDHNQLSGSIPSSLGNLIKLENISFNNNQLVGSIPSSFGNCSNLKELNLHSNRLSGGIPKELGNLRNLLNLLLEDNQLTGTIPEEIGNLNNLHYLLLINNQLTGEIPTELGNLSNLTILDLRKNQLSGAIPKKLGNLSNLKYLDLRFNKLSGNIPTELGNMTVLETLFLSGNQLSGSIPTSLTSLNNSISLSIGWNALYTSDAGLITFLNSKDSEWDATQTIAPSGISAIPASFTAINLSWTPIAYTGDTGGYRIFVATTTGGPYTFYSETPNKIATSQLISSLTPGIPYYFAIQTRTQSHVLNPNIVYSENSDEVSAFIPIPPAIGLSKTSFNYGSERYGIPTPSESVILSNTGTGILNWTATPSVDWISVLPGSGTNSGVLTIGVSRTDMPPGYYTGAIAISDPKASNSPQTIIVGLDVIPVGSDSPPFGNYETPLKNSTVASSIPVTGWVLDDVGVQAVKIYRGTGVADRVYIGDAIFSHGARPDVEAAYPGYPQNDRAGWGYMLLTNFLPNGGNGPFTLLAYATDTRGQEVLLGSKAITCDNLRAVKPFGAIDTPVQGGTVSGSAFINFGWALTPLPNLIPLDGATITAWVNGLPLGHPTYNNYRSDIATLFPGYANSNGAVGYYYLNTTSYANGVYTIAWSVADSGGNVDGIGSRYFTIQNVTGGSGLNGSAENAVFSSPPQNMGIRPAAEISEIPEERHMPVYVRRGYRDDIPTETVFPEADGSTMIKIPEVSRVKINLNEKETLRTSGYEAYEFVKGELRPLPIGATFDSARGIFYWQPGPGFLGNFDFVFIDIFRNLRKSIIVRIGHM